MYLKNCIFPLFNGKFDIVELKLFDPTASVSPAALSAQENPNPSTVVPFIVDIFNQFELVYLYICNLPLPESKLLDPIASVFPSALIAHEPPNLSAVEPSILVFERFKFEVPNLIWFDVGPIVKFDGVSTNSVYILVVDILVNDAPSNDAFVNDALDAFINDPVIFVFPLIIVPNTNLPIDTFVNDALDAFINEPVIFVFPLFIIPKFNLPIDALDALNVFVFNTHPG